MPDTDTAILGPVLGCVQRKTRIVGGSWEPHSRPKTCEEMDTDGYVSLP